MAVSLKGAYLRGLPVFNAIMKVVCVVCPGSSRRLAQQERRTHSHLAQEVVCPNWGSPVLLQVSSG